MGWPEKLIIAAIVAILAALVIGVWFELSHPCVHKVNCRMVTTYVVVVGSVAVPTESERCDCLERAP